MIPAWLKRIAITLGVVLGVGLLAAPGVQAIEVFKACSSGSDSTLCSGTKDNAQTKVTDIVNLLLWVVGIISVVVIIIGGIMFAVSAGDPGKAAKARMTVIYAAVGVVVALFSAAIVSAVSKMF